ncbi:hypothetical protein [Thalassoglobus polymorphus]|uniref:Uncharacterized protein n=1 Tax=Thalassoglobus polymorphus TaxID=2527994 RepID=A0A517QL22_9PLAN|nr:hypothetical protein [Thalassoglobus polymorphus]QDT32314.1 hypothetical protein Mal48_15570 [Thalassoglobus polymorphus]
MIRKTEKASNCVGFCPALIAENRYLKAISALAGYVSRKYLRTELTERDEVNQLASAVVDLIVLKEAGSVS